MIITLKLRRAAFMQACAHSVLALDWMHSKDRLEVQAHLLAVSKARRGR